MQEMFLKMNYRILSLVSLFLKIIMFEFSAFLSCRAVQSFTSEEFQPSYSATNFSNPVAKSGTNVAAVPIRQNSKQPAILSPDQISILPDRTNRIEDIYLRFYNGSSFEEYVDFPLHQACRLLEIKGFDNNSPTVLYVHGFIETAQQESVQVMVNAYLEARPDTNVILLDWSNMSHGSYLVNAARNTKKVGAASAEHLSKLIEAGLSIDKFQVIGHSLGSHVAGYLARDLRTKYNKTLKRLTALDPAFPAFYPDGVVMDHVTDKDAEFVDVIHTDAGGYGAPVRTGTADFWPNGGKSIQPGCPRFAPIPLSDDNLCSHWRSWRFYAESIRNPEAFPASPADSYHKFRENQTPEVGMVYMGANCDTNARGSYYLTTNAEYPFGKGMDGIYPKNKNIKNKK